MMEVKPRVAKIVFFSGGKGGGGVSTIVASFSVALSELVNRHVLVVDFGYGPNATTTKLFGQDPGTVGVYDFVFGRASPRPIKVEGYRVFLLTNGYKDPNEVVDALARAYASNPYRFTEELTNRLASFLTRLALSLGVNHIIVDLPSTTIGPHTFAVLAMADVINIVALHSNTHIDEVASAYKLAIDVNPGAVVNVVVNKVYPTGDPESQFKQFTHGEGRVFPIEYSVYVSYIVDVKRDIPIAWEFPGNWRRDIMRFTQSVKRQVDRVLSAVRPSA